MGVRDDYRRSGLCPRCYGTGIQYRPHTADTLTSVPCERCRGTGKKPPMLRRRAARRWSVLW